VQTKQAGCKRHISICANWHRRINNSLLCREYLSKSKKQQNVNVTLVLVQKMFEPIQKQQKCKRYVERSSNWTRRINNSLPCREYLSKSKNSKK